MQACAVRGLGKEKMTEVKNALRIFGSDSLFDRRPR